MSQLSLAELMAEISRRSTDEFDVLRQHMDTLQVVHQLKLQSAVGDKTDWETMRLIREMVAKHKNTYAIKPNQNNHNKFFLSSIF